MALWPAGPEGNNANLSQLSMETKSNQLKSIQLKKENDRGRCGPSLPPPNLQAFAWLAVRPVAAGAEGGPPAGAGGALVLALASEAS